MPTVGSMPSRKKKIRKSKIPESGLPLVIPRKTTTKMMAQMTNRSGCRAMHKCQSS